MELQGVHYDAFISYRHSELDSFVAENLHKKLESFKVPKAIKKLTGKSRLERVFHDEDEMAVSDNLSDLITNALANSDYLICICTPRYLESRWCMKEIETFLTTHDRNHVLLVLAEAEPQNSFPVILTYEDVLYADAQGNTFSRREIREPLAADVRGGNKREILKAMDVAVVKLMATILGLNYDDLKQRERERRFRRIFTLMGSAAAVLGVFAIFAVIMLLKISNQNQTISQQYNQIQDKYAGSMATASKDLLSLGRRKDAVYAARSVLPDDPSEGYNSEVYRRLTDALNVYSLETKYYPETTYDVPSTVRDELISVDNKYIAIEDYNRDIHVFKVESGKEILTVKNDGDYLADNIAFCGTSGLIYISGDDFVYTDFSDNDTKVLVEDVYYPSCYARQDGEISLIYNDAMLYAYDSEGDFLYDVDLTEMMEATPDELLAVSFDEKNIGILLTDYSYNYFLVIDAFTGSKQILFWDYYQSNVTIGLYDELFYFSYEIFDYDTYTTSSKIYALNITTGQTYWIQEISNFVPRYLIMAGDYLYAVSDGSVVVFDSVYGTLKNHYYCKDSLSFAFEYDDKLYYVDQEGRLNFANELMITDLTLTLFEVEPGDYVISGAFCGDSLYYNYSNSDYVVRYRLPEISSIEAFTSDDYEHKYVPKNSAMGVIEDIDELDGDTVDSAFYSNDEEYIVAVLANSNVKIFDADEYELVTILYDAGRNFVEMGEMEDKDAYYLSALSFGYVLDKDFRIISMTESIVGYDDGDLILCPSDGVFFRVPFVEYDDMIEMADEYLGKYVPSEKIKLQYNMKDEDKYHEENS